MGTQNYRMNKVKTIQSPDGIALSLESMWLRHNLKLPQPPNNVFIVELPPLTDEDKTEMHQSDDLEGEGIDYWIV